MGRDERDRVRQTPACAGRRARWSPSAAPSGPETRLRYNVHRYYDPETARYTSPDPLGLAPAPNPDTYITNPHSVSDPLGLAAVDENDVTWGGRVTYQPTDHLGRAKGVFAILDSSMMGGKTNPQYDPVGWVTGRGYNRAHLLGAQLGGSNKDPRNFVTMHQYANTPIMRDLEGQVRKAVDAGEIVHYRVTPHYDGQRPPPQGRDHRGLRQQGIPVPAQGLEQRNEPPQHLQQEEVTDPMTNALEQLSRLLPRPDGVEPKDWDSVRRQLGTDLPADYKAFVDTYGGGYVDAYLWVLEPGCANEFYDLIDADEERAEAYEELWDGGEEKPAELDGTGARLIPWASTDNGEFLFWLARPGQDPDEWTVMVNEARGPWWEHLDMGFSQFLAAALTGEVRSEILSDSFPTSPHDFRSSADFV
ncbi:DNA/RNA non-specific endonuclease [Kitasatospora sp. NPDC048365]|uniref:DNA/RNA non-specific endonuclease n=1 Tax=Kitasatospora sp. NPDC048365 TaxID=3364050 RepID=UPI00371985D5